MEDVMTYLYDQRKAMPEEVYLELGRKLADAKDTIPELFVVTWFSMSCNIEVSNDITTKRHQAVCVAVESHEEPLRRSNKPTPPRILPGPVPQGVDGPQLPTAARDARLAGLLNHGHAAVPQTSRRRGWRRQWIRRWTRRQC